MRSHGKTRQLISLSNINTSEYYYLESEPNFDFSECYYLKNDAKQRIYSQSLDLFFYIQIGLVNK